MRPEIAFDLALEHGRCVGVRLPDSEAAIERLAAASLLDDERAFAETLPAVRRRTWVGGRAALREGLRRIGLAAPAVLPDPRGAPVLPEGLLASISHKEHLAVALVAPGPGDPRGGAAKAARATEAGARGGRRVAAVGVDLELDATPAVDIASKVLTPEEEAPLRSLPADERGREVLLRFSLKEAVYKALSPFVRRYVGFHEVTLVVGADGRADVATHLRRGEGPFAIEARWRRLDGVILTTARIGEAGAMGEAG